MKGMSCMMRIEVKKRLVYSGFGGIGFLVWDVLCTLLTLLEMAQNERFWSHRNATLLKKPEDL